MKITSAEEYGLRCLMQLAGQEREEPLTITDIAKNERLSLPLVGKIMGILKDSGLVESVRGRSGGYVLNCPAEELTLSRIFKALEGKLLEINYCEKRLGRTSEFCVHVEACSIQSLWESLVVLLDQFLEQVTLADLEGNQIVPVARNAMETAGRVSEEKRTG